MEGGGAGLQRQKTRGRRKPGPSGGAGEPGKPKMAPAGLLLRAPVAANRPADMPGIVSQNGQHLLASS